MRAPRGFIPPEEPAAQPDLMKADCTDKAKLYPQAHEQPPREPRPSTLARRNPIRYLSSGEVAAALGMQFAAFRKMIERHPTAPAPDAITGPGGKGSVFGYLPGRENEMRRWRDALPGTGSGERSGRWLAEAQASGSHPDCEWIRLTGSRGSSAHLLGADLVMTLCGRPASQTEPAGEDAARCKTCGGVAAQRAARG